MTKPDSSFLSALEGKKRLICIDLMRESLDMTLAELNELSRGELGKLFSTISVSDLLKPDQHDAAPAKSVQAGKQQHSRIGAKSNVVKKAAEKEPARSAGKSDKAAKPAGWERTVTEAGVNTRKPEEREAFDKLVLDALKTIGGDVAAGEIQERVGGTNLQIRAAVNRLIEAGQVTWTGQARGTRYRIA